MLRFILHRLLMIVPTFIGITLVAFVFIRMLPGDPVLLMAGERAVSPERRPNNSTISTRSWLPAVVRSAVTASTERVIAVE